MTFFLIFSLSTNLEPSIIFFKALNNNPNRYAQKRQENDIKAIRIAESLQRQRQHSNMNEAQKKQYRMTSKSQQNKDDYSHGVKQLMKSKNQNQMRVSQSDYTLPKIPGKQQKIYPKQEVGDIISNPGVHRHSHNHNYSSNGNFNGKKYQQKKQMKDYSLETKPSKKGSLDSGLSKEEIQMMNRNPELRNSIMNKNRDFTQSPPFQRNLQVSSMYKNLNQKQIYDKQDHSYNIISYQPKKYHESIRRYPKLSLEDKDEFIGRRFAQLREDGELYSQIK